MKSVVKFSLKQIVFINVVFILLIVSGLFSLFTSPVENMPPVDIGRVFISTVYYGASAEDVENLVTREVEDAIKGIENVEYIHSTSRRNYSTVDVKFIDDTDYRQLYDELRLRVLNIKDDLPPEVEEPIFTFIDTQVWMPVIVINIVGEIPNYSLKLLAEELKSDIMNIQGVRDVKLYGEYQKEFHVSLNPEKLRRFGITFSQVVNAIKSANTKIPTGQFRSGRSEYMLDAGLRLSSQEEVLNIVIRRDGDRNFIRVRDLVTSARLSHRDPDIISSVNGSDTIRLFAVKEDNANSVKIAKKVKSITNIFQEEHINDGITIELTYDSTVEIHDSINTLSGNMMLGMIFVIIVLWLTLGFRNAMLTAIGIPFSFLCAIILLKFTGQSINTISLFSFVLVSGIIVDDAVIIIENVYRHLYMGKTPKEAIIDGVSEVMLPVISSVLTTIVAFIPMLIMTGSTGEFFSVIPKAVTYALVGSLIEALFILPIHILDWGPKKPKERARLEIFSPIWKLYHSILNILLVHKIKTLLSVFGALLIAIAILGLSITGIFPFIKVEFFPGNYFRYHITVTMPSGTSINETDSFVRKISTFIMSSGEKQAQSASGLAGMFEDEDYSIHSGHQYGQVVVTLPEEKIRDFPDNPDNDLMVHLENIRKKLSDFVLQHYDKERPKPLIKVFAENTGPPVGKKINIRVSGNTLDDTQNTTDEIMRFLRTDPQFFDLIELDDNRAALQKSVQYTPRQEAAFEYGLSPGDITMLVSGILKGQQAGKFRTLDEEVDLLVRVARENDPGNVKGIGLISPEDIMKIPVIEHSTAPVYISDLVNLKYINEPDKRTRYSGKPAITITSNIRPGSKLSAARVNVLVTKFFKDITSKYPGVILSFGGEFESTSRAYTSLTFAFIIAVMAIYMILASQFKDYFQPLIIISGIAFAFMGVVFGMFLTRSTFTVGSFLAVVGLAGVAVNDSLILIDFINVRKREGMTTREAILEACSVRMRPVLITTATTMLGLLPMAIGIPRKSISWAPMATAFVTGLSSATILTLLIVPVEYEATEKFRLFLRKITKLNHDKGNQRSLKV